MKGQPQIISIIIIMGIIVLLIGATYFWGKPLIDKRVIITQAATIREFMGKLDEKIVTMARSCTGFCDESLTIPPGSYIKAYRNDSLTDDNNSVVLEFAIGYPMMGNGTVPLNTNVLGEVAPYGETNGVITMRQILEGSQYKLIFKIHYRELDTRTIPIEGYKILLEPEVMTGHQKISISFGGTSVIPGGAANGGSLTVTRIKIDTI